jgi:elongation factor 1-gamma
MSIQLYDHTKSWRANKILIAAQYAGVKIDLPEFEMGKTNKTEAFLKLNPRGQVPTAVTSHGTLWESNAIARYVARLRPAAALLGNTLYEQGQVDAWIDYSQNEIEPPRSIWLYPILRIFAFDGQAYAKAKKDVAACLATLNAHLQTRTYLVGERVTLADIAVASPLVQLFQMVLEPKTRAKYVNVTRWFDTLVNQPEFRAILGQFALCKKEQRAPQKKKPKTEKKKKEQKPKPAPKKKASKPKHWSQLIPRSSMVMDDTKRLFSNAKPFNSAYPEFYEKWDNEGFCVYTLDFKYNAGNSAFWKSENLCGGINQRLESLRKFGYGALVVTGHPAEPDKPSNLTTDSEESDDEREWRLKNKADYAAALAAWTPRPDNVIPQYPISGVFIFRGQGIPEEFNDCPDADGFTLAKVDMTTAEGKKLFEERFSGDVVSSQPVGDSIAKDQPVLGRYYFK